MSQPPDLASILELYPAELGPTQFESLGSAGGYSGARFWKLYSPQRAMCLRRWPPEHPSIERLRFIHNVLAHVAQNGFGRLPLPQQTLCGETLVEQFGQLWQLEPWILGAADYKERPNATRLRAAFMTLAEFHRAAATFADLRAGPSPGIEKRLATLRQWQGRRIDRLEDAMAKGKDQELVSRGRKLVELFRSAAPAIGRQLSAAVERVVPLQPCIRDIHDENVFFEKDEVTGLIDFGSLDFDHVSTDIARLLGSMAAEDADSWRAGLSAYGEVAPLSDMDRELIHAADRGTVLLSGMNWLDWIFLEGRQFEDRSRILARLDTILSRLRRVQ